jgi:tetratricopeptide (TPR) repeat protein
MKKVRTVVVCGATVMALASCGNREPAIDGPLDIPRTTTSVEARAEFDQGIALLDRLRAADAREHFRRAVDADPAFAWAHLMLAMTSPTTGEFWDSMRVAQQTAASASDGERLLIAATTADVNGDEERQLVLLEQLVAAYPGSARARVALANFLFERQDWCAAIEQYRLAIELAPDFSPPYNQLGYCLRFTGDLEGAEAAFRQYVELIPDEPNPYDSLAELLWKQGRYEDAIAAYRKALEQDPRFVPSYVGIGNNQILLGDAAAARETFRTLEHDIARNAGERRQARTWAAISWLHEGNHDAALREIDARRAIAEETDDRTAIANDLAARGEILLDAGRVDAAEDAFEAAVETMDSSNAPPEVKANYRRNARFDRGRIALARGELDIAAEIAETFRTDAKVSGVRQVIWQAHELVGMVELAKGDPSGALYELELANPQDARVMYLKAKAYLAIGMEKEGRSMARQAADFNGLSFTWPLVRDEARHLARS